MRILLYLIFLSGCAVETDIDQVVTVEETSDLDDNETQHDLPDLNFSMNPDLIKKKLIQPSTNPLKHGVVTEWYANNIKKKETNFENGIKNGPFFSWYSNGQLKQKSAYQDDRLQNSFLSWYENGNPRVKGFYSNGKRDGEWILYDPQGNPMPSVYYEDGVEVTRVLPSHRD